MTFVLGEWTDRLTGNRVFTRGAGHLVRRYLARRPRVILREAHIYYFENRIAFAQIYPFLRYRRRIERRFGVTLRFFPVSSYLSGRSPERNAAHIMVQTWFDADPDKLTVFLQALKAANPDAPVDFIDAFATNELRLGRIVDAHVRFYLKKSLFRDRAQHFGPWKGDTNLADYSARYFKLSLETRDYQVPATLLPKLKLTPNFFTAPQFFDKFRTRNSLQERVRTLDVHARMDLAGGTRQHLRRLAFDRMCEVPGTHIITEEPLSWKLYMDEMRRARLCLSPFGYGELCWRDIEAFLAGAVLIKPDMRHLDTLPDLYVPQETYLPVCWDYADLPEVVEHALADASLRRHLTETAWVRTHSYLANDQFLDDMAFLWEPSVNSDNSTPAAI